VLENQRFEAQEMTGQHGQRVPEVGRGHPRIVRWRPRG
jgi:hypothetical protein